MTTTGVIRHSNVKATNYDAFTLEAVEGDRNGKVHWLKASAEGEPMLYAGFFTAEPGTFTYTFGGNETFHVLDGGVFIKLENGDQLEMAPGDVASFPKGHRSTWTIKSPFKKFFVISS